jgi:prepilin-type processing-associated H-X9-DG protein
VPISYTCPFCGKASIVGDEYAGRSGPCFNCGNTVTIPLGKAMINPGYAPPASSGGSGWPVIVIVLGVFAVGAVLCAGVLAVLLIPAVQAAREAAQRTHSQNNLKQIAIAFHNYHDTYHRFPPAYQLDADGNKSRSWRVAILPFIEQKPLFDLYKSDQPWDSPENQIIVKTVLPVYRNPADTKGAPTDTSYMVITGPGTIFEGDKPGRITDIRDGTSNTILAIEVVGSGVKWAEPKDLDISTMVMKINGGGANSIGSPFRNGANVAMADGSVRFMSNDTLEATLRAMITRDGREAIP